MIAPPIQTDDDDDDDNDGDGDNKSILVMKMFKLMTAMIVTMTRMMLIMIGPTL